MCRATTRCFILFLCSLCVPSHLEEISIISGADERNRSDDDVCAKVDELSRREDWKAVVEYTLDSDKRYNLSICEEGNETNDCCPVKSVLISAVSDLFNTSFSEKIYSVSTVFALSSKLFNFSFLNLLNYSKFDLHNYLLSSYGYSYEENSHFFSELFWDLEKYFTGISSINLLESFLSFFDSLVGNLLTMYYGDFTFKNNSLECISRISREIKPFGDVPSTLGTQMRKSFQLVRIFSQSLRQGQEILTHFEKIIVPVLPCSAPVENMLYCSYCLVMDPSSLTRHCSNFSCVNLIQNHCLKGLEIFHKEWLVYVDELVRFIRCFDGPCNIENVVETIEKQISQAIYSFKDTASQFFNEVGSKCGFHVSSSKEKRSFRDDRNIPSTSGLKNPIPSTHPSQVLMDKVRSIKVDIESRRNFIGPLVSDTCQHFLLPAIPGQLYSLNCSSVINYSHSPNESMLNVTTSKEVQFVYLSQKVRNISEKMRNILSSYEAFVSEKTDMLSSGYIIYSSGSGDKEDIGDGVDDDGDDDDDVGGDDEGHITTDHDIDHDLNKDGGKDEEDGKDIAFEENFASCGCEYSVLYVLLFLLFWFDCSIKSIVCC